MGGCPKGRWKGTPYIGEANRIRIIEALEHFLASTDEVYTFGANLAYKERIAVHQLCKKMGMTSKSSGRGNERCVSVYKRKRKNDSINVKENVVRMTFSDESKMRLQEVFASYPPGDDHFEAKREHYPKKMKRMKFDIFSSPSLSKQDMVMHMDKLASNERTGLKRIAKERSKLPIASFRDLITSTVENNQVVLISGETGCGKTTQVPQYLLDYMWAKHENCKIVCTQPRRISATSVCERVARERGETVGNNIGYKIRLETKCGRNSSIVFCTNGVLLRLLVSRDSFGITHIIVDEVHERDHFADFLLTMIRDMLPSYPNLRLVLMSATLDSERFSQYFGGCPVIHVPGFTHPVQTFFLEDVLSIIHSKENDHDDVEDDMIGGTDALTDSERAAFDEAIDLAWSNDEFDPLLELISSKGHTCWHNYQHSSSGLTPLMVFAGKGRIADVCKLLSFGASCHLQNKDGLTALNLAEKENMVEVAEVLSKQTDGYFSPTIQQELLSKYLATTNADFIDISLIERLIRKICADSDYGAILVFFPGWDDITKTREKLMASSFFNDSSKFIILSLHSLVPSAEQKKVFTRPAPGCRKIILSTNIAETAVTIDDVVYVIDSGRMKEKSYDPHNNISILQSSWISKASAKQREGRAGRCQPGICYHLYSKVRAASLPDFQVPEMKRMSVEYLCLQVTSFDPICRIDDFLMKTLDPPLMETIRKAIIVLQDLGALSADENLTDLGRRLSCLPVHPLISKMLFFAILVNCLDPALTLACATGYKDPFILPLLPLQDARKLTQTAKLELSDMYGGFSDQLAIISAFECWRQAKAAGKERSFCSKYLISSTTMHMIQRMRSQLESELISNGFMHNNASSFSVNAHDPGILRSVVVAGLYPKVGRVLPPNKGKCIVIESASGSKVRLHPRSLNYAVMDAERASSPLVVYDEISRGDGGMYIRNCTVVGPLYLLLLSSEIAVTAAKSDGNRNGVEAMETDDPLAGGGTSEPIMSSPDDVVTVVLDSWLTFSLTALDVARIYCLRERLHAAILFKVTNPRLPLPPVLQDSVDATAFILSYDGLSGSCLISENTSAEPSMVSCKVMKRCPSMTSFLASLFGYSNEVSASTLRNDPEAKIDRGASRPLQPPQTSATQMDKQDSQPLCPPQSSAKLMDKDDRQPLCSPQTTATPMEKQDSQPPHPPQTTETPSLVVPLRGVKRRRRKKASKQQ